MRPHEETWQEYDDGEIGLHRAGISGAIALFEWPEQQEEDREVTWARARLAAQAPAAIRMLLKIFKTQGPDRCPAGTEQLLRDAGLTDADLLP